MKPALLAAVTQSFARTAKFIWVVVKIMEGLYRDNGKENGNYSTILGYILGLYGCMSKLGSLFGVPQILGAVL